MLKIIVGAVALAFAALPATAMAQSKSSNPDQGQVNLPSKNSGAGVKGMPGNKNGPAPMKSGTTGQGMSNQDSNNQKAPRSGKDDAAKVSGKPGGKSGPAVMPPSKSKSKQ